MTSAKDAFDNIVDMESKKRGRPRNDGGLGQDELRDRWAERYPHMAYSRKEWMAYQDGYWSPVDDEYIKGQVVDILEGSRGEGVKVTSGLVRDVYTLCRIKAYANAEVWDSDPDVLVFANGTLEISERRFREHRPEDWATLAIPYEYDPEADCPVFKAVLTKAVPDEMSVLQEFAGYCLTPDTDYEAAIWLQGPRGSGKSTIIEGFMAMLGPKYGILGLGEIEMSRFALGSIPGKTLLTSTEQPASYLKSTHIVDALISGEMISVERKNLDAIKMKPTAKIIWAMNDLPRISNTTSGIFRRVNIIEFPELVGQRNPEVKKAIREEAPGILNWALEGLGRLREQDGFVWPESVKKANQEFQKSNDLPAQFLEEMCAMEPHSKTSKRYLYEKYAEWAREGGNQPVQINRLSQEFKRLGLKSDDSGKVREWVGVRYAGFSQDFVT